MKTISRYRNYKNSIPESFKNLRKASWQKEFVNKKLGMIEEEADMYKTVGPALIKMTRQEIQTEVNGWIEILSK